jgi:four helix bundle protein
MQDFRKLEVWKEAHRLVMAVYQISGGFPPDEQFGLTSQIRRASVSIPANIAEGCGRDTRAELLRFLYIAMGSASEVEYFIILVRDLGFVADAESLSDLEEKLLLTKRLLYNFIRKVKAVNQ